MFDELLRGFALSAVFFSPATPLYLLLAWVIYTLVVGIYNISPLHPLYRFPGPRLAAASYHFEACYDYWLLKGQYGNRIRRMHEQYGPIVRINPDELHCNDPAFTDEIYAGPGRIRDKWQHNLNVSAARGTIVTGINTVPHEVHRIRRGAYSRFFSRTSVTRHEGEIRDLADAVADKLLKAAGEEVIDMRQVFNCFVADVISQVVFGEPLGFVAQQEWTPNLATFTQSFIETCYMMRSNWVVRKVMELMPMGLVAPYMGENVRIVMHHTDVIIPAHVRRAIRDAESRSVFAEVAANKILPKEERTIPALSAEGFNFLVAGTESTAGVLTVLVFHLLANRHMYDLLMEDLSEIDVSSFRWTDIEQKPYCWALVQEALRMMPGVSHRSARIARTEELIYRNRDGSVQWVIPRNTPVSMTSMINHWDPELFPDPDTFNPERWLVDGKQNYQLQKSLLSFSRGARECLGKYLAYCEIYIMLATMVLHVLDRARLFETTVEDLRYDHDMVIVQTKKGSIFARIKIL